jgi:hypothetical protein
LPLSGWRTKRNQDLGSRAAKVLVEKATVDLAPHAAAAATAAAVMGLASIHLLIGAQPLDFTDALALLGNSWLGGGHVLLLSGYDENEK